MSMDNDNIGGCNLRVAEVHAIRTEGGQAQNQAVGDVSSGVSVAAAGSDGFQ